MGTHVVRRRTGLFARSATLISCLVVASCASDPPPPAATPEPVAAPAEAPPAAEPAPEAAPAPAEQEATPPAPECQAAEDCGRAKGDPPTGSEWLCEGGACTTRALPEPVKAEPAAAKPKAKKGSKKGTGDTKGK